MPQTANSSAKVVTLASCLRVDHQVIGVVDGAVEGDRLVPVPAVTPCRAPPTIWFRHVLVAVHVASRTIRSRSLSTRGALLLVRRVRAQKDGDILVRCSQELVRHLGAGLIRGAGVGVDVVVTFFRPWLVGLRFRLIPAPEVARPGSGSQLGTGAHAPSLQVPIVPSASVAGRASLPGIWAHIPVTELQLPTVHVPHSGIATGRTRTCACRCLQRGVWHWVVIDAVRQSAATGHRVSSGDDAPVDWALRGDWAPWGGRARAASQQQRKKGDRRD